MADVDFQAIAAAARPQLSSLLPEWLPGGKRDGAEYVVRNPKRNDSRAGSFKVNVNTGRWSDFATGDEGGDAISLVAYLRDQSQPEAARALADEIGLTVADLANVAAHTPKTNNADPVWTPVLPVPAELPKITVETVSRFAPAGHALGKVYKYADPNGRLIGYVVRFDRPANGEAAGKEFRPIVFADNGRGRREWRSQGFPVPRPLYRLPQLAAAPDAPVLVVEGEKTADAAAELFPGHAVVTSPNGSKSARKADWSPLAGRDVVVWPDADEPGSAYAADVAEMVAQSGARSIRTIALPAGLPDGWDLADVPPRGMTMEMLRAPLRGAEHAQVEQPLPLFPPLPPAERFPIEHLGPVLSRAAAAITRKVQVPEAIAGQSVLAAAALAAQAFADVQLPYGQPRPLSLFFVSVAASGDRKSTADNEALWPVAKREAAMREEYSEEMKTWRIAHGAWSAERKKIEGNRKADLDTRTDQLRELGEEPPKPLAPFLTSGDLTLEGLTKAWIDAHPALGIFTAEAGQFTSGHAMGEDSRLKTAAMLSDLWDGKPVKRLRVLDGVTILPGRRLSCHLLVQPDAAAAFLGNGTLRDQGLLSRMLVAAPKSLAGTRLYRDPDPADDAAIRAYGARLLSMMEREPATVDGRNELDPRQLTLDADAADAWRAFFDHVEQQCGCELRPIVDFASKAAEQAARIAGVLTIIEDVAATEIGLAAMVDALTIVNWYLVETMRLANAGRFDAKLLRAAAMLEWLQSHGDEVLFSDMLQRGPGPLRTKAAAEECVSILVAHGWLAEVCPRPRRFKLMGVRP